MRKFLAVFLAASFIFLLTACGVDYKSKSTSDEHTSTVYAMDTYISLSAYNAASETFEEFGRLMTDLDSKLSRTNENSDIGKLNKAGKESVTVSLETAELLKTALQYCEQSSGIFDITIAPITDLWNINGSNPKVPDNDSIMDAMLNVGYEYLSLKGTTAAFECRGMKCDLGGIAKGFAADKAVELLKKDAVSSAVIQVGSSVYILGTKPDGSEYSVGIRNPLGTTSDYVGKLNLKDKYITSSGDYERYFEEDGVRYCHIFDTETGYPINNDLHSVTVISDSGTEGDYLSTLLFCLGLEEGMHYCKDSGVSALFITKDKRVCSVGADFDNFELTAEDFTYEK